MKKSARGTRFTESRAASAGRNRGGPTSAKSGDASDGAGGYLSAVRDMAAAVDSAGSLRDLLETDLDFVLGRLGWEVAAVHLRDESDPTLSLRAWRGFVPSMDNQLEQPSTEHSLFGWSMREGVAEIVPDVATDSRCPELALQGVRTAIVAPIRVGDVVAGTLLVASHELQAPPLHVVEFLEAAAAQIGLAVRYFRLLQAQNQSAKELETLHWMSRQMGDRVDVQSVLSAALASFERALGVSGGAIYKVVEGDERLECVARRGISESLVRVVEQYSSQPSAQRALRTGSPVAVRSLEEYDGAPEAVEVALRENVRSILLIPLVIAGRAQGVVSLCEPAPRDWTPSEIRLAQVLAGSVGGILTSLRFLENASESTERLGKLYEASMQLMHLEDLDRVALGATECGRELLRADAVAVHTYHEEYRLLKLLCASPPQAECAPAVSPANRGLLGKAIQQGKPVSQPLRLARAGFEGFAAATPLKSQDEVIGVLSAYRYRDTGPFLEADAQFIGLFANMVAATLHNAQLFARSEEFGVSSERNRIATEMHDTVSSGMAALLLKAQLAREALDTDMPHARAELDLVISGLQSNIGELRRIILALRPLELEQRGLIGGIEKLAEDFERQNRTQTRVEVKGEVPSLGKRVEYAVFRAVQECLNNIRKYAAASSVTIEIRAQKGVLVVTVEDDGEGFDTADVARQQGLGFLTLKERVRAAGGTMQVESQPGKGTCVAVTFPIISI